MENQPSKIFLQIDADGETPDDFKGLKVSWADEQINDNDLVYYSEDEVKKLIKKHLAIAAHELYRKIEGDGFGGLDESLFEIIKYTDINLN